MLWADHAGRQAADEHLDEVQQSTASSQPLLNIFCRNCGSFSAAVCKREVADRASASVSILYVVADVKV